MDGVTIIETLSQEVATPIQNPIIIILALLGISIAATSEAISFFQSKRVLEAIVALSVVFVSLFIGLVSTGVIGNRPQETLYIVSVDDSVSAKEFHANYEILSVDDDKYTVRYIGTED